MDLPQRAWSGYGGSGFGLDHEFQGIVSGIGRLRRFNLHCRHLRELRNTLREKLFFIGEAEEKRKGLNWPHAFSLGFRVGQSAEEWRKISGGAEQCQDEYAFSLDECT